MPGRLRGFLAERAWRGDRLFVPLLLVVGAAVAFVLRLTLLGTPNRDVAYFDEQWLLAIRTHGFHALSSNFSNYTPLYLYYLGIADYILRGHVRDEVIIKLGPILADFILAFFVYKLVRLRYPRGPAPAYAALALLFAPTVCLNSAYWGQTDSVWAAGLVAAVYFILRARNYSAFGAFGIAYAFKQQSIFLLPFLVVLAWRRRLPLLGFLLVPTMYLLAILPAWIAGRPLVQLLKIYVSQAHQNSDWLTLYAPTVYQWLPMSAAHTFQRPALIWGLAMIGVLVVLAARAPFDLTPSRLMGLATASVLVVPFVLPKMHDRYFYAADVLTIVLAFYVPEALGIAITVQLCSLFSYWPFLFRSELIPLKVVAIAELAAILVLLQGLALGVAERADREPRWLRLRID